MICQTLLKPLATSAVALLLVMAFGCTPKTPPGTIMSTPDAAWKSFRRHYCVSPKAAGMKVKASLYYTRIKPRKRTNRTIMTMWGNFDGAMRLDVAASIGKLLAHIREDDNGLLVFYPSDEEAYTHISPVLGATRLGMPFPFSLSELGNVLVGDFSGLAPKRYTTADRVTSSQGGYIFTFDNGLISSITLDVVGRPVRVEGRTTKSYENAHKWLLEINRFEESTSDVAPLPDKITLALDNGEKGVLHIKSRELMIAAWPAKSLNLILPNGITPIRLDNGYHNQKNGEIPVVYEDK
ncbi:hypothetical protein SYK_24800 [Pseudodesulfovibrio nedwellii]|uniref:DUF4292 domain-containing protein n=1 Tax=Pseudodesulfovibrio nedwellii TaxID=2973072 RepID=A0ABM8B2X3_9BACT|nr:hypothetical protein [Pseudodesulfovibrio nedwellii]BDQ38120.1 hypothetical protein SYK_24800 [Pseudodesulfovibrio nedwellii]